MLINIRKSRTLKISENERIWLVVLSTILSSTKTLVSQKNAFFSRISYLKRFSGYTLEVNVLRSGNNMYVLGVNKNVQLELPAVLK